MACTLYYLNPLDYSLWSFLEAKACPKPPNSLESFNHKLIRENKLIIAAKLRPIPENFVTHLSLCNKAKEGHFDENVSFIFVIHYC